MEHPNTPPPRYALMPPRPSPLLAGGALLALAVVSWQIVTGGLLTEADHVVHEAVAAREPSGASSALQVGLAWLGSRWLTVPVLLLLAVGASLRHRNPRPLLGTVAGIGALAVVGTLLKVGIGRTPPAAGFDAVSPSVDGIAVWLGSMLIPGSEPFAGHVSYPSGHAANAVLAYVLAAWLLFGRQGLWPNGAALRTAMGGAAVAAATVGTAVVLLDYHWVSDTLGGWLVGLIALWPAGWAAAFAPRETPGAGPVRDEGDRTHPRSGGRGKTG